MPRMKTFSPRHFAIWKCVCERHCARGRMRGCNHGVQMLVTTAGAFAAFSLMTIAVGTDYWLYSRGVCRTKSASDNDTSRKNEEVLTHSGLWRMCCMEGMFEGMCKTIDHFPEDAHYEQDASEYLLRAVRASSLFPIMSVGLLFIGGLCVAASEFYKSRHNVILSAGIFFVSAGLSNIIGIIVYISANAGDPNQSESKRSHWYGWSFYCGALSFVIAETVGVLTVHLFIDRHRALRARSHYALRPRSHTSLNRRSSSQRSRYRRRPSRSSEPRSRDHSPARQSSDLTLYALSRGFVTTPHTLAHNSINAGRGFSPVPNSFCAGHGYGKDRVHATNSVPTEKVFCHGQNSVSSENGPLRAPAHLQNSENSQKAVMQTQLYKNSVPHPSAPHPNSNNIQNPHNLINEHIHLKNSVKESVHALKTGTVTRRTTPV